MIRHANARRPLWPIGIALVGCATAASDPPERQAGPQLGIRDATDLVADALRSHALVLISEHHWSVPVHEQLRRIIADENVGALVQDIVVEFGNSRYQGVIDRYIAGEHVPIDSLRLAWRNTTQLLAWDSPLYARFYETVRAVNAGRPPGRRLRVLAGDPPIDWSRTHRAEDIPRTYGFRDIETLGILEREVLGKGRRAIVIIGEEHVLRTTDATPKAPRKPLERQSLGEALHERHPGTAFLVGTVVGERSRLARAIRDWPNGSMARIAGTAVGLADAASRRRDTTSASAMPAAGSDALRMQDLFDAILYAGPVEQRLEPLGATYREDASYEREIRRRIEILRAFYRVDIWSEDLDRLLRAP
ncbi:MAG TPA: hypothetical protein VH638_00345 [Gemmatimonadaceae bacterium]|jgi:hypothetical protein